MTTTGSRSRRWTAEEEEALRAGVEKHGDLSKTNWSAIQKDPEFALKLHSRTTNMMKTKWRSMKTSKRLSDTDTDVDVVTTDQAAAETTTKGPRRWTAEEEEALRAGVEKYGVSRWSTNHKDPELAPKFHNRTTSMIKGKWSNMNISRSKQLLDTDTDVGVTSSSTDHPSVSDSDMKEDLEKLCRNKDVADEPDPEQRKAKWTAEEVEALRAVVAKYGVSASWNTIHNDPEFAHKLRNRTLIMKKDKWRNMNISKSKRLLDTDTDVGVTAPKANPTSSSTDHPSMKEDLEKLCRNKDVALGKRPMQTSSRETLDSAAETTVAPCVAEAQNKVLIAELEFLEAENKVLIAELELQIAELTDAIKEKMKDLALGMDETIEAAAETAARLIAEAEHRDRLAELAVRKAEIISEMAEHAEAKLELAKQLLEQSETSPLLIAEAEDKDRLAALAVQEAEDVSQMSEHADATVEQLLEKCVLDENRDTKTS